MGEKATVAVTSDVIVRDVLARAFPGKELKDQKAFTRAGMSPEDARRRAMVRFGGGERAKERTRDEFRTRWSLH